MRHRARGECVDRGGRCRPYSQRFGRHQVGAHVFLGEHGIGKEAHLGAEQLHGGELELGDIDGVPILGDMADQPATGREPQERDAVPGGEVAQRFGMPPTRPDGQGAGQAPAAPCSWRRW